MCTDNKKNIHVFTFNNFFSANNIYSWSIKKQRLVTCHDSLNKMMAINKNLRFCFITHGSLATTQVGKTKHTLFSQKCQIVKIISFNAAIFEFFFACGRLTMTKVLTNCGLTSNKNENYKMFYYSELNKGRDIVNFKNF